MDSTLNAETSGAAGARIALVIGNSLYGGGEEISGTRDAIDMKDYLEQLGFTVLEPVLNGGLADMEKALTNLKSQIAGASVVVFFYSGHGYQVNGRNFLMPIGGSIEPSSSLPLQSVEQILIRAPEALKLVILDACRDQKKLPPEALAGFAEPTKPPRRIIYAFAASSGSRAASGSTKDDRSPYTTALLRHLREPGLEIREFLARVNADVTRDSGGRQRPIVVGLDELPEGFFMRPPVVIQAKISKADDDLLVLLHGEIALAASRQRERELRLKAGDNPFALLVANGKSFHNNHDWDVTEGWNYEMKLELPDGTEEVFQDNGESTPFKDGPHHGQVFVVARANLLVDPETAKVTVKDKDTTVWRTETPFYARDQEILYEKSVADLPIDLDEVVREALRVQDPLLQFLVPVITEILRSGQFLGHTIADPKRTFVLVLGNKAFKELVDVCMNEHQGDRIGDLKAGMSQVLSRTGRPFATFDRNLVACIQEEARHRGWTDPKPEEIFVWTAIDDRSRE